MAPRPCPRKKRCGNEGPEEIESYDPQGLAVLEAREVGGVAPVVLPPIVPGPNEHANTMRNEPAYDNGVDVWSTSNIDYGGVEVTGNSEADVDSDDDNAQESFGGSPEEIQEGADDDTPETEEVISQKVRGLFLTSSHLTL